MPNYEEDEYLDLLHHTLEKGETRGNERTGPLALVLSL